MPEDRTDALDEGRRALAAGEWEEARAAFAAVLQDGEQPEARDGLGLALWFLGEIEEGLAVRQLAFAAYAAAGDCDAAARLGVWISHQYLISGRGSLANGWLERAERALDGQRDCAGQGWVLLERARRVQSVAEAADGARRAMEIGRATGDEDLEVFALSLIGRSEISSGAFEDGMRRLEEAMAAATAGRIGNPHTLGEAYCNLIVACTSAGDWERASEWCELVDGYASRHAIMPLFGACRTIHADVLVASGRWEDAETALEDGLAAHARGYPAMGGSTLSTLASLRIRQGRLAEAEQLLAGREEEPGSLLALAELRLAEGEPRVAAALLERGLAGAEDDLLGSSRLLAPLVVAHIAAGAPDAARQAAQRLEELAAGSARPLVAARAALGRRARRARRAAATTRRASRRAGRSSRSGAWGCRTMRRRRGSSSRGRCPPICRSSPVKKRARRYAGLPELGAARGMDAAAAAPARPRRRDTRRPAHAGRAHRARA